MKKRISFVLLLAFVLCLFTACRGGNQNMTTVPTTAATMPTTQATTMPETQPETTRNNGNGPLDTQPGADTTQEPQNGAQDDTQEGTQNATEDNRR